MPFILSKAAKRVAFKLANFSIICTVLQICTNTGRYAASCVKQERLNFKCLLTRAGQRGIIWNSKPDKNIQIFRFKRPNTPAKPFLSKVLCVIV